MCHKPPAADARALMLSRLLGPVAGMARGSKRDLTSAKPLIMQEVQFDAARRSRFLYFVAIVDTTPILPRSDHGSCAQEEAENFGI